MGNRGSKLVFWTATCACVLPALLFNIAATLAIPGSQGVDQGVVTGVAFLAINVMSVLVAPASLVVAEMSWKDRNLQVFAWSSLIAGACLFHNITNALDKVAVSRSSVAESRESVSQSVARLSQRRHLIETDVDTYMKVSQGVAGDLLDADIATLRTHEIYKRTKGCAPEATDRQDSKDWCAIYRGAAKRSDAAKKVAELRTELAKIDTEMNALGPVAVDADPQVANLAALLNITDLRFLAIFLNAKVAVLVELVGTIGPMIFAYLFRRRRPEAEPAPVSDSPSIREVVKSVPQHVPEDNQLKAVVLLPGPQQHVEMFVRQKLDRKKGSEVQASALYDLYTGWCGTVDREALNLSQFGSSLKALGFEKVKKRNVMYQDVAIK